MTPTPIPANTESSKSEVQDFGITQEFLQKALTEEARMNGTPVPTILSYKVEEGTKPGDNYMSVIYSIDLELENSPQAKRHLLMKCYPTHPARQEMQNKMNVFFKELEVYRKWMPELRRFQTEVAGLSSDKVVPLPYAPFVYGESIDFHSPEGKARLSERFSSFDNFIIMEDIRKASGFRMTNRREPLDIDHMRLAFAALARVHSLSWVYRQLVEPNITAKFPCLTSMIADDEMEIWTQVLFGSLARAKETYDKEFGEGNVYSKGIERYKAAHQTTCDFLFGKTDGTTLEPFLASKPDPARFGKDAENPVEWRVISHGDCWSNNMLFKYDETTKRPVAITLVDLQMAEETCLMNDLEYVVHASTDREMRKKHLTELLQLYVDTFDGVCALFSVPTLPGFNLESLKFRFHRAKFVGYFMANMGLPIMLKEAGKVENLEDMDEGKDLLQAFSEISDNDSDILKNRLIGIAQDMHEDGVL